MLFPKAALVLAMETALWAILVFMVSVTLETLLHRSQVQNQGRNQNRSLLKNRQLRMLPLKRNQSQSRAQRQLQSRGQRLGKSPIQSLMQLPTLISLQVWRLPSPSLGEGVVAQRLHRAHLSEVFGSCWSLWLDSGGVVNTQLGPTLPEASAALLGLKLGPYFGRQWEGS